MNRMLLIKTIHEIIRAYPREEYYLPFSLDTRKHFEWNGGNGSTLFLNLKIFVTDETIDEISVRVLEQMKPMSNLTRYKETNITIGVGEETYSSNRLTSEDNVALTATWGYDDFPCDILWTESFHLNMDEVRKFTTQVFSWIEMDVFHNLDDTMMLESFTNCILESVYWENKLDEQ